MQRQRRSSVTRRGERLPETSVNVTITGGIVASWWYETHASYTGHNVLVTLWWWTRLKHSPKHRSPLGTGRHGGHRRLRLPHSGETVTWNYSKVPHFQRWKSRFEAKNALQSSATGALPRTPLGELAMLPGREGISILRPPMLATDRRHWCNQFSLTRAVYALGKSWPRKMSRRRSRQLRVGCNKSNLQLNWNHHKPVSQQTRPDAFWRKLNLGYNASNIGQSFKARQADLTNSPVLLITNHAITKYMHKRNHIKNRIWTVEIIG